MAIWPRQSDMEGLVGSGRRRGGAPLGRPATALLPLVAVLLVCGAACSGGSGGTGARATGSESTVPGETTTTTSQPATTVKPGGPPQTPLTGPVQTSPPPRPKDSYLPVGVVDQISPPGTKAFELLADGKCGPLLRQIENAESPTTSAWRDSDVSPQLTLLYTAAAHACLSHWSIAQADFQQVKLPLDCGFRVTTDGLVVGPNWSASFDTAAKCHATRMLVYNWTKGLLAAHKADPKFVPNFPTPPTP